MCVSISNNLHPDKYPSGIIQILHKGFSQFGNLFTINFSDFSYAYCIEIGIPNESRLFNCTFVYMEGKQLPWGITDSSRAEINYKKIIFYDNPKDAFWNFFEAKAKNYKEILKIITNSSRKFSETPIETPSEIEKSFQDILSTKGTLFIPAEKNGGIYCTSFLEENRIVFHIADARTTFIRLYRKFQCSDSFSLARTFIIETPDRGPSQDEISSALISILLEEISSCEKLQSKFTLFDLV
jgi:hypothetical protein